MKIYLNKEQTNKLIELGMPSPKYILDAWAHETDIDVEYEYECAYSIGELIEILGVHLSSIYNISRMFWVVNAEGLERSSEELVDTLYDMIIKLKNEEVL